ncbi:MAG TPA: S41 family peptidase [Pyrinomonadaceae bacterium]|nr:S41 family peptidase [Pyrinomonadaceae bacterium]
MKLRSTFSGTLLLIAFLFTNAFSQSETVSKSNQTGATSAAAAKSKKTVTGEAIERDFAEALIVVQDKHVKGGKIDYNELFKSVNETMLQTLDPHSNYYDSKDAEQFRTRQSSQYFGIGALLGDLRDENGKVIATYIRATFEGAPANRAGLLYGDKIVSVNGASMLGKTVAEVRTNLIGARGTQAKITVQKYGSGKQETVEITRDAVSQPSISEFYMLRPGVGYISMSGGFNQTTYAEFVQAMRKLKTQGMNQLVLDLRNNPGGLVIQATRVANTFLARGQKIFTQKGRIDGVGDTYYADNESPDKTPLVVLVNGGSASASEILAGALQDHDRALIVGEDTFGKGLVQLPFNLEYGSMLLLTIAKYETPSGRLIQHDYSDGSLYNYYNRNDPTREKPKGAESKTDSGRAVYSGGGINPDEVVKANTISAERFRAQQKLADPVFAFALDVAYGKIPGFENLKVDRPIAFDYDISPQDFPVTENLFQSFKKFAADKYKIPAAQIDKEREFIQRSLRTELVTAAYGSTTSYQVFKEYDNQLKRAVELFPAARQLAIEGAKANARKPSSQINR